MLTIVHEIIAAILTYLSKWDSGELPPFWPHFWLLSFSVLASFAVGIGILFERPKHSDSVHRIAFWLVMGGIAIEACCTIFLFVFDEGISSAQQSTMISLEEPRDINFKIFDSLLADAGKMPFSIQYTGGGDTEWLAGRLFAAFGTLHWPVGGLTEPVTLERTELCRLVPDVTCIGAQTMGVTVLVHEPPSKADESARSLVMDAFVNAQIGWIPSGIFGSSATSIPPGTIRIIVAPRP